MPNAVWSGALSFGLVSVPVRLFPATEPKDVRFHQYDRSGRRVRYRRVADDEPAAPLPPGSLADDPDVAPARPAAGAEEPADRADGVPAPSEPFAAGRTIDWNDVLLGRETEGGETVLVEREEIERLRPRRSATIDIEDFVELDDIDPVYFEKTYHAVPRSADDAKPYALLHRAMQRSARVGIGRFVLRTKPHLVAVRPMRDVIAVETLFFGDEVRDSGNVSPVDLESVALSERELALAEQLIEMLRTDWNPDAYADTYREELLELLATKTPVATTPERPAAATLPGRRIDELMAALRESVEAAKRERSDGPTDERSGERRAKRAG